ncbi:hypothetical protein JW948_15545 [bacterium]|nr:hypothetical protein [bacterium]
MEVEGDNGICRFYEARQLYNEIRSSILEGVHGPNNRLVIHHRNEDGTWNEIVSTLWDIIKKHFKLRVLYQPVRAHVMAGLKWGIIVGIILKVIDAFIGLLLVEPGMAFCLAGAIAVSFIPKIPWWGYAGAGYFLIQIAGANIFLVYILIGLTGAIPGCLPGMAIGGIVGFNRRRNLILAGDAVPESNGIVYKGVVLPFASGLVVSMIYVFVVIPWLAGMMV